MNTPPTPSSRTEARRARFKGASFLAEAHAARRAHALSRARAARAAAIAAIRAASAPNPAPDAPPAAPAHGSARKPPRRPRSTPLCVPEWLLAPPPRLASDWLVLPRPSGKRVCLVTSGGNLRARFRNGRPVHTLSGLRSCCLPGGGGGGGAQRGATVLDCVLPDAATEGSPVTLWVLDALVWNGRSLHDCTAEFRQFWLREALSANVCAGAPSCTLSLRVPPLHSADVAGLRAAADPVHVAAEGIELQDGLLFFLRAGHYAIGVSPLVCAWKDKDTSPCAVETPPPPIWSPPNGAPVRPLVATLLVEGGSFARGDDGRLELMLATADDPPVRMLFSAPVELNATFQAAGLSCSSDRGGALNHTELDAEVQTAEIQTDTGDGGKRVREVLLRVRVANVEEVARSDEPRFEFAGVAGKGRVEPDSWSRIAFQCRVRHNPLTLDEIVGRASEDG